MRRRGWILAAVVLLALAAVLMFYGEKAEPPAPHAEVEMPRRMRQPELKRMEERRTLATPAPAPAAGQPQAAPPRPRDPVLTAITASAHQSAVVIEANAIRFSPVGQLLIDCLASAGANGRNNPIEEVKQKTGIDVLQDLDRVAVMDEGVVLSGNFGNARWDELMKQQDMRPTAYGDKATIYEPAQRSGGGKEGPTYLVTWNKQMLYLANSAESARAVVDQLEGRGPQREPLLNENQTYGEIYGVLSAKDFAGMLPPEQSALAEKLSQTAEKVELHVDTSKDVGVVANVNGPDGQQMQDLGKSLGAAMAVARMQAQASGEKNLAELLDLARVRPEGNQFKLEMALPLSVLEKQLSICRDRHGAQGHEAKPATP